MSMRNKPPNLNQHVQHNNSQLLFFCQCQHIWLLAINKLLFISKSGRLKDLGPSWWGLPIAYGHT